MNFYYTSSDRFKFFVSDQENRLIVSSLFKLPLIKLFWPSSKTMEGLTFILKHYQYSLAVKVVLYPKS